MDDKTHRIAVNIPAGVYERLVMYALKEHGGIRKIGKVVATSIERYLDAQDMRQKLEGSK